MEIRKHTTVSLLIGFLLVTGLCITSTADASERFLLCERVNMVVTSDGSLVDGKKTEGKNNKKGQRLRRRQISYFETVLID